MANSSDRFYQLEFKDRPVLHGDIGSLLKISGLVLSGGGTEVILLLPSHTPSTDDIRRTLSVQRLTEEEWSDFLRRSDDPEILVGMPKIFQRKVRWEVSSSIQQKVWAADGFECFYCGAAMGKAKMTVDHFVPLELGGANDETNYLTACAACNKHKANMEPKAWCALKDLKYDHVVWYLQNRKLP